MTSFARPLKIALCVHGYFPEQFYGTAVYVRQLAAAFARLGHVPHILTTRVEADASAPRLAAPGHVDGVPVSRIVRPASRAVRESFDDPAMAAPIRQALREIEPDVIHAAHFLGLTSSLFSVADELAIPTFATLTDFHSFCHRGTAIDARGRVCAGPDARRANCLGCGLQDRARERPGSLGLAYLASPIARATTAVLLPYLTGVLPAAVARDVEAVVARPAHLAQRFRTVKAALVPTRHLAEACARNGLDLPLVLSPFGVDVPRSPRRDRSPGPLKVGFIGQLAPHKGCHRLLEALRGTAPGAVDVEIWGDVHRHPRYARRLKRLAEGRSVAFMGTFEPERIAEILSRFDLLAMPSLWPENAPLTLLQALACKVPVVAFDQPGMTDFVRDGVNGFVVPAGDARGLGRVLRAAAADPRAVDEMRARTHYDRGAMEMAEDALALYRAHGVA